MARYLLDTNVLSYLIDTASPGHGAVRDRLASCRRLRSSAGVREIEAFVTAG